MYKIENGKEEWGEDRSISVKVADTIIVSGKVTDTGGASASCVSEQNAAYKRPETRARNVTQVVFIGVYSRLNYRI